MYKQAQQFRMILVLGHPAGWDFHCNAADVSPELSLPPPPVPLQADILLNIKLLLSSNAANRSAQRAPARLPKQLARLW